MIEGDYEDEGQVELNWMFDHAEPHRRPAGHLPPDLQAGSA